jgi:hypothetical protein
MHIPYSRPTKLSDPCNDSTPELLEQLLAIPDDKLEWHHLQDLLGPFLPAGTYQEAVYFLPIAFKSLDCEEHALDLTTSVCWFISENADRIAKDGLLDECRSKIRERLLRWVSTFNVEHFDRDGCAAKGWGRRYFDYVPNCETLCQTLCDLDRFVRHADLADDFIMELALSEKPVSSAWFLELARARSQNDVYPPPTREVFESLFADRRLLEGRAAMVRERVAATTASPTYWKDVFSELGLENGD